MAHPVSSMDGNDKIDEEAVRRTAFFLWEQDGRPAGRNLYYWDKALEQHIRQLAYDRWLAEGAPEGNAETYWRAAEKVVRGEITSSHRGGRRAARILLSAPA